ncbi:MAG: PD-(D/E)XK nuclease family protein [Bacteroidetes bacterium]|nr:PD-(D/E)XK nuclease family protein [Bacteroidota bacterium]
MTEPNPSTFLGKLSSYLKERYPDHLQELALVFPNRRAGLYIRRYMALGSLKPMWAPAIFSIEDFVMHLGGKRKAENHQLLLILYKVYQQIEKENAHDLNEFLNWAPVMLDDFNEIDLYLADPASIFSYLSEAKALSTWNLDKKPLTEFQLSYLHFFNSLNEYYQLLQTQLEQANLASQGSAYRYAADTIEQLEPGLIWKKILFAGFNALTGAEEKIISYLIDKGKAEIFWDADNYYTDNPIQEAGKFLRQYQERQGWGEFRWKDDSYSRLPKEIRIIGIPQNIGQAKVAGQLISEVPTSELSETALVLGDENMLIPVLNSVPEEIGKFNVTMGLPLRLTPMNGLFDALFQLHIHAERLSKETFYFKDLLTLFRHPFFSELLDANHANAGIQVVEKGSGLKEREEWLLIRAFFSRDEVIRDILKPGMLDRYRLDILFGSYSAQPLELLVAFQELCDFMKDHFQSKTASEEEPGPERTLEMEYLYAYSLLFRQILETWEGTEIPVTLGSVYKLFRQAAGAVKLSFYGEPLTGLQVMGMLETRTLDFRNIIVLHVNDDIIPSGKGVPSFIPIDIKDHFHLPTYRDRQAVFAYHFYRLLQRAEKVDFLYNTEPGQLMGGEKSRFLHQLRQELTAYNPSIRLTETTISFPPEGENKIKPIVIQKDRKTLHDLTVINSKGWSPTVLNMYRVCPLRFYFSQILKIQEPDEADENMDAATVGTVFHEILELLYQPTLNQPLTADSYKEMKRRLPELVRKKYQDNLQHGDLESGKNLLMVKVTESLILQHLDKEKDTWISRNQPRIPLIVIGLEKWLSTDFFQYRLGGKVDRIDQYEHDYYLIDYKTGKLEEKDVRLVNAEKLKDDPAMDKVFQLMIYSYLFYKQQNPKLSLIIPGIISLRRPAAGILTLKLPEGSDLLKEGISMMENLVKKILDDLYNPEVPFIQTENLITCTYCLYKPICIR